MCSDKMCKDEKRVLSLLRITSIYLAKIIDYLLYNFHLSKKIYEDFPFTSFEYIILGKIKYAVCYANPHISTFMTLIW